MTNIKYLLSNKVFWTVFLMFVVGGVQAISQSLTPTELTFIMAGLGMLASYFHLSFAQSVGAVH